MAQPNTKAKVVKRAVIEGAGAADLATKLETWRTTSAGEVTYLTEYRAADYVVVIVYTD